MQWLLSASPRLDVLVWIARCVLLLGALLFTAFLFQWWRVHRWFQGFHKARHLVSKGRFQEAEEGFRRAAREASGTRHVMALAALGVCRLQQGEYAEAVALMEPLMDEPLPRRMRMDGVALAGYLALSLAMLGETRRARRWLDEAHRRFGGRVSFVVLPEVVILCREGHLGAALSLMNHSWPVLLADGLVTDKMRMFRAYVL
ncbi:MAG TPA: tetratricopeptide repeat protein, partial [Archangium sp.]|uniref:tetratricopeptide repeat protein n=1 Tax=Archangium sp. TaxID=1872627 RepID=UPI002ED97129